MRCRRLASELVLKAREMTNAFSSMEYPHWLMVAGAVLLVFGLIGVALRQRAVRPNSMRLRLAMRRGGPRLRPNLLRHRPPIGRHGLQEQTRERDGPTNTAVPRNR